MKKFVSILLAVLMVFGASFALIGCVKTEGIEGELAEIQAIIDDLKSAVEADNVDLTKVEAALAKLDNLSNLSNLGQLTEVVTQLKAVVTAIQAGSNSDATKAISDAYRLAIAALPAQSEAGKGVAYGVVHNWYIGEAVVEVNASGRVTRVQTNEYWFPTSYTNAKYIMVGNAVFMDTGATAANRVSRTRGDAGTSAVYKQLLIQAPTGTAAAELNVARKATVAAAAIPGINGVIADFNLALSKYEALCEWYVAQLHLGAENSGAGFKIMKEVPQAEATVTVYNDNETPIYLAQDGTKTAADYSNKINKRQGIYWAQGSTHPLGWLGNANNMDAFAKDFIHLFGAYDFTVVSSQFTVGGLASGATWSDFRDYWLNAQAAFIKARTGDFTTISFRSDV